MLRPYVQDRKEDWNQHLAAAEYTYNSAPHDSTAYSPFYLNYGQEPLTPAALITPPTPAAGSTLHQDAATFAAKLRETITTARENLQQAVSKQKTYADKGRADHEFQVGDLVTLSAEHLRLKGITECPKLSARRVGPSKITAKFSPVVYRLELPPTMRIFPTFHISKLTPYHTTDSFPDRQVAFHLTPQTIDRDDYWSVKAIVARKWDARQKQYSYKVRWVGYDAAWDSWHLESALSEQDDVAQLIKAFNAAHPEDYVSPDDIACEQCSSQATQPPMLLCDSCNKGYHTACLTPPLARVPKGKWYCPACRSATAPVKAPQRRSARLSSRY
jgi:hypothetical protein